MNCQQIANQLKQSGFEVVLFKNQVRVSLNRPITTSEVQTVLDIPSEMLIRSGKNVLVSGIDS